MSQNVTGTACAGGVYVKLIMTSGSNVMNLMIIFKHVTEIIWKVFVHKFIPNFIHWTSNISFTFNKYNCLKSGSVWALYLLFVIIRRARFCNFNMRNHSKPQFVIPNWRCERISESYINFIAEMGKYRFSLFITPSVREILFAIFWTCEFQFIYSFTVRPRKLNSVTRSIRVLFIMRHGISFSVRTRWRTENAETVRSIHHQQFS